MNRTVLLDAYAGPSHIERRQARELLQRMMLRRGVTPTGPRAWRVVRMPFGLVLIVSQSGILTSTVTYTPALGSGRPSDPVPEGNLVRR